MISGHTLPGETVEVALENEKRDYYIASVKKIIDPSPDRIRPPCKYFGSCGGCHFQYIDYRKQVQLKEEILKDCLKRIAAIETGLDKPLIEENPWYYRIRGQFKVSNGNIGFYRKKTRDVIDIDNCPLMSKELNAELLKTRSICKGLDVSEIHLSKGDCSTALLRTNDGTLSNKILNSAVSRFLEAGFTGVCTQSKKNDAKCIGKPYITLRLANLKYSVSAMSFIQSHWKLNQTVAGFVWKYLSPINNGKILDLYAGAGNFSILLAGDAEITAVEENPYSVADGKRNLELNSIKNCKFIYSPVEKFNLYRGFDIILVDPPRSGLAKKTIDRMLASLPGRIVYISCNPATFARDLKNFLKNYDIESVRLIDFFPQTFHIESLAFLKRKFQLK